MSGGVYVLYQDGRLRYVGRTGNLRSRVMSHARLQPDAVKYRTLRAYKHQRRLESSLIARLRPPFNRVVYLRSAWTRDRYGW
jgi:excinuclease UvrABC nuclease subunit